MFEAGVAPGGVIGSGREGGWLVETGPNTLFENTPDISAFLKDLGLHERRLVANPAAVNNAPDFLTDREREIVALSESARTESVWVRTRVLDGESQALVAEMILNSATLKASYAAYDTDARALANP